MVTIQVYIKTPIILPYLIKPGRNWKLLNMEEELEVEVDYKCTHLKKSNPEISQNEASEACEGSK